MNQLTLILDPPRARRTDPAVSHAAAASARDLAKQHAVLVLGALMAGPCGVDEIARRTGLTIAQISKRMCELERAGAARPTGATVRSSSGRQQRQWERV